MLHIFEFCRNYKSKRYLMKSSKKDLIFISVFGLITGAIAVALVAFGNPANMGFCIACFIRDSVGALKLHNAAPVQYIRPEIIGLVLGAFIMALLRGEFKPKGGSAPLTRFVLAFFAMIGCLVFLGCPFRMILRLSAGDLNALIALAGFASGILCGIFFLKKGFTLKRSYRQSVPEGAVMPAIVIVMLILLVSAPAFIVFSESGPGSKHAPLILSLGAGLAVGAMAQYSRLCMVGGIRDLILFKEKKLILGFAAIFLAALAGNIFTGRFNLGLTNQYNVVAHFDILWNFLGMMLAGFCCVLLGGCPLRQLVLSGEGNSDSAITVLGLAVGSAFAHNFGLAASAASKAADGTVSDGGVSTAGKIAVIIGFVVVTLIAVINTFGGKKDNPVKAQ